MTVWTWDPPQAWVRELEEVGGQPNDRIPYLKLVWEPGEKIEGGTPEERTAQLVQRWMVYELTPLKRHWRTRQEAYQAAQRMAELNGPPPRTMRSYITTAETPQHPRRRIIMSESRVTQREWELHRETGHSPKLFWVIQGSFGGHKRKLRPEEAKLLKQHGRPSNVPIPGALRYAPWDRRVRDKIAEMDRLRLMGKALDWERRSRGDFLREQRVSKAAFAQDLLKWLDSQIAQSIEETLHKWRPSDLPSTGQRDATDEQIEAAEADFVHSMVSASVAEE